MPFPAVPLPVSFAIGIPLSLGAFVAQEAYLRRRSAHRAQDAADKVATSHVEAAHDEPSVTTTPPVRARKPAPVRPKTAAAPAAGRRQSAPSRKAPAPRPRSGAAAVARLQKRQAALKQGLEAIIVFVDGPPRRAPASACADALLLAVPKAQRGPGLEAFLHAAGARVPPSELQGLAEDAGIELATAIKQVSSELRAIAP